MSNNTYTIRGGTTGNGRYVRGSLGGTFQRRSMGDVLKWLTAHPALDGHEAVTIEQYDAPGTYQLPEARLAALPKQAGEWLFDVRRPNGQWALHDDQRPLNNVSLHELGWWLAGHPRFSGLPYVTLHRVHVVATRHPVAWHGTWPPPLIGVPYQGTHRLGNWQSDNAVDLGVPVGTTLLAVESGRVDPTLYGPLENTDPRFDGQRFTIHADSGRSWFYQHAVRILVPRGARVRQGQPVGVSGLGNGVPHLHLGVTPPTDPIAFLDLR